MVISKLNKMNKLNPVRILCSNLKCIYNSEYSKKNRYKLSTCRHTAPSFGIKRSNKQGYKGHGCISYVIIPPK